MNLKKVSDGLHKLNTSQIIALGFAGVIFVGGLILWLPFCSAPGQAVTFPDAVFTAATSVCVTGLSTVVMATRWSNIGKIVILCLIQIGGIGLIALANMIFISFRRKISLKNRRIIKESYNLDQMGGVVPVMRSVVKCVFLAEGVGAVLYAICFVPEFGWKKGMTHAVFLAISAFCNAGIDLFGETSLAAYVSSPLVNLTTIGLIIVSGLGFIVWWDLWDKFRKIIKRELSPGRFFRVLRLQSKLVLTMTGILVFAGALLVFIFESGNPLTLADKPLGTKIMASFFQSVTTRTAGFYTIDQSQLSTPTVIISLLWMFTGGSPMGTAGGVKTTTIAVLILSIVAYLQGKKDVEVYGRRIRESYLRSAMVVAGTSLLILFTMSVLLSAAMPEADLADILYEITSAVATVGLSRGLTPQLNVTGKWIVILTMYLGRIGPLTLGTAVVAKVRSMPGSTTHLGEEDIMIG